MATTPPETTNETERPDAEFDFAGRGVKLLKPTDGQQFILITVLSLNDEGGSVREKLETVTNFGVMLSSLFVEDRDRAFVHGALARGGAELEDYVDLARQMSEHWGVGEETATNRTERRARERRPAQAVRTRGR